MSFHYAGPMPASKSMMNRALLIQSFFPHLNIQGQSNCDDVRHMKLAIVSLVHKTDIDCGEAGTVFRFMTMRASRLAGGFHLKGTPRLLQRPQQEVTFILNQFGVQTAFTEDGVSLRSNGWKRPLVPVQIPRDRSSQFASGVLLSAWDLPFDLHLDLAGHGVSLGYWHMSMEMARRLGMHISVRGDHVTIPAGQKPNYAEIATEPDYSSMFTVAACALVGGDVQFTGVGDQSLQPDYVFLQFFRDMGVDVEVKNGNLHVRQAQRLKALDVSLRDCPDLFPVLAALCAFTDGMSKLRDTPQLAHKESDRMGKTEELLRMAGVHCEHKSDGLVIHGHGIGFKPNGFVYDPDQDHRMAMAAALFRLRERKIGIQHIDVVKKSFPEFWNVVGLA